MKSSIGIFGDSFADPNNEFGDTAWTHLLELEKKDRLDTKITCYSSSGTSHWWSFEKFLKNYKSHDIIIFAHADQYRIPSIPEEWGGNHYRRPNLNSSPVFGQNTIPKITGAENYIEHAIEIYWKNFYNPDLLNFLHQKVFDEVNLLCKKENIKIVNLFTTDPVKNMFGARGDCIYNLYKVSRMELQAINPEARTPVDIGFECDMRACHLTQENNNALASIISQCLLEYDHKNSFSCIDFSQRPEIVLDYAVSLRYFSR